MTYKYEVAISFAEEDRNAALALALALEQAGIDKVYYYPLNYEATWGKEIEQTLKSIYSSECRYAIMLLSNRYFKKRFARIEMEAILERLAGCNTTICMLPVLLEQLNEMDADVFLQYGYIEWQYNPVAIAKTVCQVLGKNYEDLKQYASGANASIIVIKGNTIIADDFHIGNDGASNNTGINAAVENNHIQSYKFHIGNKK